MCEYFNRFTVWPTGWYAPWHGVIYQIRSATFRPRTRFETAPIVCDLLSLGFVALIVMVLVRHRFHSDFLHNL